MTVKKKDQIMQNRSSEQIFYTLILNENDSKCRYKHLTSLYKKKRLDDNIKRFKSTLFFMIIVLYV